jgi:hypothetical protein
MATPENESGRDRRYRTCGATKRDGTGEPCDRPAGWGTPHPGIGRCKLHGGNTVSHVESAERQSRDEQKSAAVTVLGLSVDMPADEALAEEMARCVGMVTFLTALVSSLPVEQLKQRDLSGRFERPSVWVEMLGAERDRLRVTAKTLLDVGLAERQTVIAESRGEMLANGLRWYHEKLINAFVAGLGVMPDAARAVLDAAAGEHLPVMFRSLSQGQVPEVEAS